jgi:hypothetical protein
MMGCGYRESRTDLFKKTSNFAIKSIIYASLVMFVVNNRICFISNKESHSANTRWFKYDRDYLCVNKSQFVPVIFEPPCTSQINKFYLPQVNLTVFKMGVYYWVLRFLIVFHLKFKEIFHNPRKFKPMLKEFLYSYSFYTSEEIFNRTLL